MPPRAVSGRWRGYKVERCGAPQKESGNILIADDEAATISMLGDLLTEEGYSVDGVGSGTA
ncbi:hypothetical protein SE17_17610, partial [Kouleothrix aurantiaca]